MTDSQPPTALPEDITEAVAINSLKSIAEQPSVLANLALGNLINNINQAQQNAVTLQQSMNQIQTIVLAKVLNTMASLGPLEAMSPQQVLTDNALAQEIADLKAKLTGFSAQATPKTDQQAS